MGRVAFITTQEFFKKNWIHNYCETLSFNVWKTEVHSFPRFKHIFFKTATNWLLSLREWVHWRGLLPNEPRTQTLDFITVMIPDPESLIKCSLIKCKKQYTFPLNCAELTCGWHEPKWNVIIWNLFLLDCSYPSQIDINTCKTAVKPYLPRLYPEYVCCVPKLLNEALVNNQI